MSALDAPSDQRGGEGLEKRHTGKHRRRADRKKRLILIIDGILLLAVIAAGVLLATRLKNGKTQSAGASSPSENPAVSSPQTGEQGAASPATDPQAAPTADPAAALTALQQQGVPAVAWLSGPGSVIDYPVVQNSDDEYYMTRDAQGKKDQNGAICLDGRNSAELLDEHIILYGNAMADGSMFGSLVSYGQQAYFAAHPTLSLYTPEKAYTIRVFAAHLTSPDRSNYPTWFETADTRAAYIQEICNKSAISSELEIPADARLISLVTNSAFDAGENSRFVIHGYLVEN